MHPVPKVGKLAKFSYAFKFVYTQHFFHLRLNQSECLIKFPAGDVKISVIWDLTISLVIHFGNKCILLQRFDLTNNIINIKSMNYIKPEFMGSNPSKSQW